jgi:hypothetical protein
MIYSVPTFQTNDYFKFHGAILANYGKKRKGRSANADRPKKKPS